MNHLFVLFLPSLFAITLSISPVGAADDRISVTTQIFSSLIEVELTTGNRRFVDLDAFPWIIKATDFFVDRDGTLVVETVDALQRVGVYRVNPTTGAKTPLSGGVDGFASELLGSGPAFPGQFSNILAGSGDVYCLGLSGGITAFDPATGNRRVVVEPEPVPRGLSSLTTTTIPLFSPQDFAMLDAATLLVADRFEGLVVVDGQTGTRTRWMPEGALYTNPTRFDLLTANRIVAVGQDPDTPNLWIIDRTTGVQTLFSGPFGGLEAGSGPPFGSTTDITVDRQGRIWVYDQITPALYRVGADGSRIIVASPEVGEGPLFAVDDRPLLGPVARDRAPGVDGWLLR